MTGYTIGTQTVIYAVLAVTVALGLPLFHYVAALMIAVVVRHARGPQGLSSPLGAA